MPRAPTIWRSSAATLAASPKRRLWPKRPWPCESRVLGPNDPLVAETLETLGSIYSGEGEYEKSAATFEKARAIYESHIDAKNPAPPEYGTLLVNLAGNYHRLGKYPQAEADFNTALDVLRKTIGPTHPIYATSLMGPGNLEMELGNYSAAEKFYNEAAPLLKSSLGETHPIYVQLLDHRAVLYQAMGNRTGAESDYRTALELRKKIYGPNHVLVAAHAAQLWPLRVRCEIPQKARSCCAKRRKSTATSSNRPAFEYANTLLALGEAERKRGDFPDARETFQKARDVAAQGLGTKHPVYANALASLALVHAAMHEDTEAGEQLRQAIAIVTESEGESIPISAVTLAISPLCTIGKAIMAPRSRSIASSFEINDRVLERHLERRFGENQGRGAARIWTTRSLPCSRSSNAPAINFPRRAFWRLKPWRAAKAGCSITCATGARACAKIPPRTFAIV